jgi:hypothetical protein
VVAGGGGGSAANGPGGDGGDAGSAGSDSGGVSPVGPGGAAGSGATTGTGGGTSTNTGDQSGAGGGGGGLYGTSDLSTLFLGSGGGGGGGQKNGAGAAGGEGGGMIYIIADSISNSGTISAKGAAGGDGGDYPAGSGAAGGGSGGSILIETSSWSNDGTLTVAGGAGGAIGGGTYKSPGAGDGGIGRTNIVGTGWYGSCWQYRKKLTLNAGLVQADMTDFPVLISFTGDSDLAAGAQSDFDDILFTSSNGTTKLDHEIEDFDNANGDIVAWVKIPFLSSSTDTDIYMYYGCGTAENQENPPEVWSNGFAGVWHLAEEQSGTGNSDVYKDSTYSANHLDDNVSDVNQDGRANGGQGFDGTDDIADIADPGGAWEFADGGLDAGTGDFTVSAWIRISSSLLEVFPTIVAKGAGDASQEGYWFNY